MKSHYLVEMDHHPATQAESRLLELLDFTRRGYGVASLDVELLNPSTEILPVDAIVRIKRKRAAFLEVASKHVSPPEICPRATGSVSNFTCDCSDYGMGIAIIDWILEGAPE